MNGNTSKRILGLAAAVALAFGAYTAVDGFAHGFAGPGYYGHGGMMGGYPGWTGHHGSWASHHGPFGGGMMGPGMVAGDAETTGLYLNSLKTRLGITDQQESAWKAFATAVTNQATTHQDLFRTMHGVTAPTAWDGTDQHLEAMGKAIEKHQGVFKAFQTLHEQLDNRQRALVATQTASACHGWSGTRF